MAFVACDSDESALWDYPNGDHGAHLGPDEQVPSLDKVSTEIPRRLPNNLHPHIVPWHSGDLCTVKDIFKRFIEVRVFRNSLVGVILSSPDRSIGSSGLGVILIREDMLRRIPSTITAERSAILLAVGV